MYLGVRRLVGHFGKLEIILSSKVLRVPLVRYLERLKGDFGVGVWRKILFIVMLLLEIG